MRKPGWLRVGHLPAFVLCFASILGRTAQISLQAPGNWAQGPPPGVESQAQASSTNWRFDVPLKESNTTSNFIFDGVSSLLQQWANTHYRNGHNIVPATIPPGTLLYHGTWKNVIPSTPEWVATDPEHSYLFCREAEEGKGCWMLTLAVTRPLNVLYFDGSSAAKTTGCLDAQDMIVWGEVQDERTFGDKARIKFFCEWGKKYGLDGVLRMEPDFEVMLCDFNDGVEVASFSNLVPGWRHAGGPPTVPPPRPSKETFPLTTYRVIESGQWHNHFPGETRAHLDLSRLISFYDPDLFPDLNSLHLQQERWEHRVANISKAERERLMEMLDEVLSSKPGESGIDWSSIYRVVIHRYADRLEALQYMLNSTHPSTVPTAPDLHTNETVENTLRNVHEYTTSMLSPYLLNNAVPPVVASSNSLPSNFSWATPVFEQCATTHTKWISKARLTSSEKLLLRSVNDVLHEICRITVSIWAEGVELGLAEEEEPSNKTRFSADGFASIEKFAAAWSQKIDRLIQWLDWSVWVKCRPACSFEETCYLPTWPWFPRTMRPGPRPRPPTGPEPPHPPSMLWDRFSEMRARSFDNETDIDIKRPQPRCLRRLQPLQMPY